MERIILLIGKSGTGKTYIADAFGLRRVVSMTTRSPRPGEVDGIHYKFLTNEDYENLIVDDVIAQTIFDGNRYFTTKDSLINKDVYIMDPQGVSYYIAMYEMNTDLPIPIVVYLKAPWYRRLYRMIKREGWKNIPKIIKRMNYDRKTFVCLEKKFYFKEVRT